ncbi:hypothetical protein KSF78_0001037 [Schistosoma japonicum]|nr:hypothetical protein KSF78_0001037 [Schistosoma japonicum]
MGELVNLLSIKAVTNFPLHLQNLSESNLVQLHQSKFCKLRVESKHNTFNTSLRNIILMQKLFNTEFQKILPRMLSCLQPFENCNELDVVVCDKIISYYCKY